MGCREDASIHDGTLKASLERVRSGLNKTGRPILFYIDAGADISLLSAAHPVILTSFANSVFRWAGGS